MSSAYQQKPSIKASPFAPPPRPTTCQQRALLNGELLTCGAPTENGADRCPKCRVRSIKLLDRAVASPDQIKPVNWRAEGMTREKRRKRTA